jgi:hypothetical protein
VRSESEVQDGQERVTAYNSKTLNKAENYCFTGRELLVIVRTLEHFRKHLQGCTVYSSLTGLLSFKHLEGQTAG